VHQITACPARARAIQALEVTRCKVFLQENGLLMLPKSPVSEAIAGIPQVVRMACPAMAELVNTAALPAAST
jgi:hypothetical protein